MDQSVIRPVKESPSPWFVFWQICLYCTLMNGCVLAVTHSLELGGLPRGILWACGGGMMALFFLRSRHMALKIAPLALVLLALLVGNPLRGGAEWINGILRRWNQAHGDGLRLLKLTAGTGDCLSFGLLVTVFLGYWCGFTVEFRRLRWALGTAAAMMALCVLGGCGNNFVYALLTAALLGVLISGPLGKPGHQGCLMWTVVLVLLLIFAAVLPGQFSGYESWRKELSQSWLSLRYGEKLLPEGNLYRSSELKGDGEAVLKVTSQQKKNLYFPAFLGGSYENGTWAPLANASFGGDNTGLLSWLKKRSFTPQTQPALYAALAEEGLEANGMEVQILSGSREILYVPATLERLPGKADKDGLVLSRGLFGQKKYSLTELSGSRPGELSVAADWLTSPRTSAEEDYARSEAVYRNFVYEQYTQVAPETAQIIQKMFHGEKPQSESVFGVLTHVRQILRENLTLDETARPPENRDPIAWFLGTSHRGGEMLFASAAVEALRSYGIPARYAEGYYLASDRIGGDGTAYLTGKNARAWVEAYFDGIGWLPLDVVPGYYYDLVSLQQMVSLPDDISKTSAVLKDDNGLEEMGTEGTGDSHKEPESAERNRQMSWLCWLLMGAAALLLLAVLAAECTRSIMKGLLKRQWRRAEPLKRAEIAKTLLYRLLSAWGIQASLGWKTEEVDGLVAEICPRTAPGDYVRVVGLLEKSAYGDIPPEIYEERTLKAFLRKITVPNGKASLKSRIRARYCWLGAI